MKVFDLVTGYETELPLDVVPGRYRLLGQTVMNDSIRFEAGSLLWSGGVRRCDLVVVGSAVVHRHNFVILSNEDEADLDLVNKAVEAVVSELEKCGLDHSLSPVMPEKLKEQAELTELEKRLISDIPFLFKIDASPRMSMRYDSELTSTSRVRRLASGAHVRLSSHSEDWIQRDFKGVSPKQLLAEVSEDEYGIYENVVYARLLDKLHVHLKQRVRALRTLEARRNDADAIGNADRLFYRLRHRLCELWGASYAPDTESSHDGASDVLKDAESLLKKVTRLRLGRLYQAIPHQSQVPQTLRVTNVLLHDQNYKRMRLLWSLVHSVHGSQSKPGVLNVERAEKRYLRYCRYVRLLVEHALRASKLVKPGVSYDRFTFGKWTLTCSTSRNGEVRLSLPASVFKENNELTFVPAWQGQGEWSSIGSSRQIVFCHKAPSPSDGPVVWGTGEDAVLNPLQFYSVERIQARTESWLLARLASLYPAAVSPWPQASAEQLIKSFPDSFAAEGRALRVFKPVQPQACERLDMLISTSNANEDAISAMNEAMAIARLMSTCKACGEVLYGRDVQADRLAFKSVCHCGYNWKWLLDSRDSDPRGTYSFADEARAFEVAGSDEMTIQL